MKDDRIMCRSGKCVDLESVDCEIEFDSLDDIHYCDYMKDEYVDWSEKGL
ncbi:hypothetical protein JW826_04585 [Candidatus Woesearchaeota archaeon]|nr:hypothetical protein [Candidatus Woesearchaeota archaeon]